MSIRVVLDESALTSYANLDGLAVGELLAMVEEDTDSAHVGIPAAAFLGAYQDLSGTDRTRLVDLATKIDGVTVILPLLGTDTIEVADLGERVGGTGPAHAIVESRNRGATLATYAPNRARTIIAPDDVLDLGGSF